MAVISFEVDDDLLEGFCSSNNALVFTLWNGDYLNGYGWHVGGKLEYLQGKRIHERPHGAYRQVWQLAYKTTVPHITPDVPESIDGSVIDMTGGSCCDEQFPTCQSCANFDGCGCLVNEKVNVDELTDARLCRPYRRTS